MSVEAVKHDPRCMGECGPCGGTGGIETHTCLTCGGNGRCQGCAPTDFRCVYCDWRGDEAALGYMPEWSERPEGVEGITMDWSSHVECPNCAERTLVDLRGPEAEVEADVRAIQTALAKTHGPASGW